MEGSALRLLVRELEEGRIGVVEVEKKIPCTRFPHLDTRPDPATMNLRQTVIHAICTN